MESESLLVHIEIPAGSMNKYEFDKETGRFRLDRVLYSPLHYPTDYGYVPDTLAEDGDPLDVMVLVTHPTFPGCMVETRIIGVLEMSDEKGSDMKLLGVPVRDPRFEQVRDLAQVSPHVLREIEHFFKTYKQLEDKTTVVQGWHGVDLAREILSRARADYQPSRQP